MLSIPSRLIRVKHSKQMARLDEDSADLVCTKAAKAFRNTEIIHEMQITCKSEIYHLDEVHWMLVQTGSFLTKLLLIKQTWTSIIFRKHFRYLLEIDSSFMQIRRWKVEIKYLQPQASLYSIDSSISSEKHAELHSRTFSFSICKFLILISPYLTG